MTSALFPRKHARHAKPAAAPKLLVAGGMTAAFAVADATAASTAFAGGSIAQFERLAQCESGGNWKINTGNGYYGGLQFNLATWRGLGFGGYPHQASKSTQIKAGQKLHSQRGWQPWPSCSRKLGLTGDGGYSGDGGSVEEAPVAAPRKTTTTTRRTTAEKASRTRAAKATREAAAKDRAARIAQMRALKVTTPPRFDGHVLTTADAKTYRIAVKHWQRRMAARGWAIRVDGHFGPQSASVARAFAKDKGIAVAQPGSVDKKVWDAAWNTAVSL